MKTLQSDRIRQSVRESYGQVAAAGAAGCGCDCDCGRAAR